MRRSDSSGAHSGLVSTQLIRPLHAQPLEIRCNVGDAIVANLAIHIVFLFERHLDTRALTDAFAHALTNLPIFAGRMAMDNGTMRIRCKGQGVPFTSVSSSRTLHDAIHSASEDSGRWLIDPLPASTSPGAIRNPTGSRRRRAGRSSQHFGCTDRRALCSKEPGSRRNPP